MRKQPPFVRRSVNIAGTIALSLGAVECGRGVTTRFDKAPDRQNMLYTIKCFEFLETSMKCIPSVHKFPAWQKQSIDMRRYQMC